MLLNIFKKCQKNLNDAKFAGIYSLARFFLLMFPRFYTKINFIFVDFDNFVLENTWFWSSAMPCLFTFCRRRGGCQKKVAKKEILLSFLRSLAIKLSMSIKINLEIMSIVLNMINLIFYNFFFITSNF